MYSAVERGRRAICSRRVHLELLIQRLWYEAGVPLESCLSSVERALDHLEAGEAKRERVQASSSSAFSNAERWLSSELLLFFRARSQLDVERTALSLRTQQAEVEPRAREQPARASEFRSRAARAVSRGGGTEPMLTVVTKPTMPADGPVQT